MFSTVQLVDRSDYFKELVDLDIRKQLWKEKADLVDQDMAPFGFILDGVTDEHC